MQALGIPVLYNKRLKDVQITEIFFNILGICKTEAELIGKMTFDERHN